MIFEVPDISLIKEKYEEMKNKSDDTLNKKSQNKRLKTGNNYKSLLILPPLPTLKKKSDKSSCENEHYAVNALLFYLKRIKEALIASSPEIESKFSYSISFANYTTEKRFSFEEMHKEEMNKVILHDELIALLLIQIKSLIKEQNQSNKRDLIYHIEDSLNTATGMSKISSFLIKRITELQEKEMTKPKPKYFINNNENYLYSTIPLGKDTRAHSISVSTLATEDNMKLKEDEKKHYELDIDELVTYISENNNKPKKMKKKKNKKKKNANLSNKNDLNASNTSLYNTNQIILKQSDNDEIESFKQSIRHNCYISYTVNKIKPTLSIEWLLNIQIN